MENQRVREKTIPVFTVLKNGAILKNIFVVNNSDFSSAEVEEILLLVGRHPDCDILLTHPSISRYHLQIRSLPSRQKLFVTDLSSVHGTWVRDQKVEPDACVEVKEGDVIRIGGSSRIYRLHWLPLSRAYDTDNPFISPSTPMEQDEENRMHEEENQEVTHQPQADTVSGDDGGGHLDVTSEGSGSSVPSEDENTYIPTRELSTLPRDSVHTEKLQPNENLDVEEAAAEKPISSCGSSKSQNDSYPEVLGCSVPSETDECDVRGVGDLLRDVMSEMMESLVPNEKATSSLPLPRDSIETEDLQLTEDSPELAVDIIEASAGNRSSCSSHSTAFGLADTPSLCQGVSRDTTKQVMEISAEPLDNSEDEVSPSSSPLVDQVIEVSTEDARHLLGSGYKSEVSIETDIEILQEIGNGVNPAGDQSTKQGTSRETKNLVDDGDRSCHSEDLEQSDTQSFMSLASLKPKTESSFFYERSDASYNLRELWGTDKEFPFSSSLDAETFEDTKPIEKLPSYYTESQENQTKQPHGVRDGELSQMNSSRSGKDASVPLLVDTGYSAFELAAEVEIMSPRQEVSEETGFVTQKIQEASAEPLTKADVQSHQEKRVTEVFRPVIEVSSSPQIEPKLIGDARGHLDSEVAIETDSQNLLKKSNRETMISPSEVSSVSDCLFTGETEDILSLWSSWQLLSESDPGAPSEILSEVNLAGDQNKIPAMSRETEQIFDDGRNSCHSDDQKQSGTPNQESKTEISFGSGTSEESYCLIEVEGEGSTDKEVLFPSTLAAETLEDTKPTEKLPSDYTESQQNQTPQTLAVGRDDALYEMDSSSRRLSTSNIWSRRGKADSVLQVRTNKGEGKQKQIGKPKSLLQTKQAFIDKPIFLKLEPEIFTPDKENLTPNSHMLKRLREVGEIKDTKGSSSKAMSKPFCDILVEENVMVEQEQVVHCMSSNSKIANEPVAQKKKAERAPHQHLLEKSSSQSQSYIEASSIAAVRNNISGGIRSSSNLSYGKKNKMKWTIVLDTSTLLDEESKKPLHLLQGLKGTHMVVPRTVLRELNETKRARCLLFRRTAEMASSALDWIEECEVNTKWWIQLQSPSEETKATAPSPPVTSQSNGSSFPFSLDWNSYAREIDSHTSEDQVLECALLYRNRNVYEKLVILSNDVNLKIKAMAEGVICETAHAFYESLKNPFSERFMWPESLPRGRTWSHVDYNRTFSGGRRGESGSAAAAKGLKLILL